MNGHPSPVTMLSGTFYGVMYFGNNTKWKSKFTQNHIKISLVGSTFDNDDHHQFHQYNLMTMMMKFSFHVFVVIQIQTLLGFVWVSWWWSYTGSPSWEFPYGTQPPAALLSFSSLPSHTYMMYSVYHFIIIILMSTAHYITPTLLKFIRDKKYNGKTRMRDL